MCNETVFRISSSFTLCKSTKISKPIFDLSSCKSSKISFGSFNTLLHFDIKAGVLPKAFALVHHIFLPWAHENSLVVQRGIRDDEFIVWCRMPYHYRHQKNLIEILGDRILGVLKHHFHQVKVLSMELPLECLPNEHQVKAPHLPVYNEDTLSKMKKCRYSNFTWFGPEVWGRLDMGYLLDLQTQILNEIIGTEEKMGISRRRGRDNEIYS